LLDHVGAKWLLTDDEVVGSAVTSGRRALQLQSLPESGPVPDSAAGPWTPAQLAFASEAVGAPRAAVIAHETRSSGIVDVNRRLSIGTDDCVLEIVAPGVATHGHELLGPLIAGARLVRLAAGPADCDAWHELVRREHVTVLHAAPDVVERMLDQIESWPSPSSMALPLRLVLLGGPSTPSTALLRRCRQVWSNAVVASLAVRVETGGAATLHVADETTAQRGRWPRGRALAGRRARVLDEHGRLNRPLIPGNLFFGPGGIASAYCGHAAETARVFVPDPQSAVPGARLFATGERAWYLAGGDLEVLSASDSRPVVHGVQVDLDALERMLGRLPGIADAAIVVRDAGASEEQPHCVDAYVVLDVNCTLDAQRLTQELAGQLPDFLVPRRVIAVPRLARCANGRLDPIAVPSGDSRGCTAPDALREVTRVVGSLFAQLLNVETVESDDDFFLLGGYSLLAIELVARIKEVFGVTLPLVDVFEFPTVQQLAGRIDAELGKAGVDPQRIVDVCATVDAADRKNERAPVDVMRRSGMAPV
jgi:pristinamycin I synthase-3/4